MRERAGERVENKKDSLSLEGEGQGEGVPKNISYLKKGSKRGVQPLFTKTSSILRAGV
jgi:hypothetical protein